MPNEPLKQNKQDGQNTSALEKRVAELERKLEAYETVMSVKSSTIEFRVPVEFRRHLNLNGVQIRSGLGAPASSTASRGSFYLRRDGGSTSTAYVCYDGTNWSDLT